MDDNRIRFGDRRQSKNKPRFPFKDGTGTTLWECRRKTPDRRIGKIEAELLCDAVFW